MSALGRAGSDVPRDSVLLLLLTLLACGRCGSAFFRWLSWYCAGPALGVIWYCGGGLATRSTCASARCCCSSCCCSSSTCLASCTSVSVGAATRGTGSGLLATVCALGRVTGGGALACDMVCAVGRAAGATGAALVACVLWRARGSVMSLRGTVRFSFWRRFIGFLGGGPRAPGDAETASGDGDDDDLRPWR